MFDGMAKAAHHQMQLFLGSRYLRIQTTLDLASDDIDDTSPENITHLAQTADRLVGEQGDELRAWLAS